jgi:hypothetical protein
MLSKNGRKRYTIVLNKHKKWSSEEETVLYDAVRKK